MQSGVDILLITAAEGEDDAVRGVDDGALGSWTKIPGPDGYGFDIWGRQYQTPDGGTIHIALTRPFQTGVEASGNAAGRLVDFFKPRCLAMCGVCAGRPDWTNLGDVIVADRLWRYDVGELLNATPGAKPAFKPDVLQYPFRPQWKQAAEKFEPPTREKLLKQRPRPRDLQALWLLKQLLDTQDPLAHADCAAMCADWTEIVNELKQQKRIRLNAGQLILTKSGREFIQNTLAEHAGQLPPQPDWKIHVGPFGTGSSLIRDVDIWPFLEDQQHLVRGFDMEASVIGLTALVQDVHRMIVVKGVMDYGLPDRHRGFRPFAARAAAEVLIAFLREHVEPGVQRPILLPNTIPLPPDPSPAMLLNARYETVPFSRHACPTLWQDLERWCGAEDTVSVRLLVGPGGSGKTRLLIELASELRKQGWQAGFWPEGRTQDDLTTLLAASDPTLMVIDYAEARPELLDTLKTIAHRADGAPLRVVLLAREVADWWLSLRKQDADVQALLDRREPTAIQPIPLEGPLRQQLFDQACGRFAELRDRSVPPRSVDLSDERFDRLLYLQMAALAVVEGLDPAADKLLDGIVTHEQHFWTHRFADQHPNDYIANAAFLEAAARSVAALTLRGGAPTVADAKAINERATGPSHEHWVRFLESLYPGRSTEEGVARCIAALEPDLLGEQLIARVLADTHTPASFLSDVFNDNDPEALRQAFVVLGRISLRDQRALGWMQRLLTEDVNGRAPAAFLAAMTLGDLSAYGELGRILAARLEESGTREIAILIERSAPEQTVSLREVCAWATQGLLQALPADAKSEESLAERARLLNNLGNRLSELGRREEAWEAAREALQIRRKLAATRPDAFLPDLALSLNNLGNALSDLGRREEALDATREALEHYRKLAATRPDAFLPYIAGSLNNLGAMLSELGRREEALDATREALEIRRKLAATRPDAFLPDLAMSLNNLGAMLSELGRREEALDATRDAVEHYRKLAATRPDAFLPYLAGSLNNLGAMLSELGRREEALEATREAVRRYLPIARAVPGRYLRECVIAARNLAKRCEENGREQHAEPLLAEAAALIERFSPKEGAAGDADAPS